MDWPTLRQRLADPLRVTVQREETFEEVGAYSLTRGGLASLAAVAAVAVMLLTFGLAAATPLRRLLPATVGEEHRELRRLQRELADLEAGIAAQDEYNDNVRRILVGDVAAYDAAAVEAAGATAVAEADLDGEVERVPEDEQLRREVATARRRFVDVDEGGAVPLSHLTLTSPLDGEVSAAFDAANRHFGVDVVAPAETPIRAALDGHVVEAARTQETGNVIAVQHAGELLSLYKHNSALLKRVGDPVRAGEAIAVIGNTGERTDGPHLHFELWYRGRPVDPVGFVSF